MPARSVAGHFLEKPFSDDAVLSAASWLVVEL
jgi:hypothetical protein